MPVTFHISTPSDREAFKDGNSAVVKMPNLSEADSDEIEQAKASLEYAFEDIWNAPKVMCVAEHEIQPR